MANMMASNLITSSTSQIFATANALNPNQRVSSWPIWDVAWLTRNSSYVLFRRLGQRVLFPRDDSPVGQISGIEQHEPDIPFHVLVRAGQLGVVVVVFRLGRADRFGPSAHAGPIPAI